MKQYDVFFNWKICKALTMTGDIYVVVCIYSYAQFLYHIIAEQYF